MIDVHCSHTSVKNRMPLRRDARTVQSWSIDCTCRTSQTRSKVQLRRGVSTKSCLYSRNHLLAIPTGDSRCLVAMWPMTAAHEGASGQHRRVSIDITNTDIKSRAASACMTPREDMHVLTLAISHGDLKTRDHDRHQNPGPHMYAWSRLCSSMGKLL